MHVTIKKIFITSIFMSFGIFANADLSSFDFIGMRQVSIKTSTVLVDGTQASKIISVHNIIPSEFFLARHLDVLSKTNFDIAEFDYSKGIIPFSQSPGAVDLGMSNVPVLDQGDAGTCMTFSTTAAMDALIGRGDFISQQCSLELDMALGQYYWEGATFPGQIIEPLRMFGIVQQGNCNATYPSPFAFITLWDYISRTDKTVNARSISYTPLFGGSVDAIKQALNKGRRVVIAFSMSILPDAVVTNGFDMVINGVKTSGGLWACKQPSSSKNYCVLPSAGHAVVVIGYDDAQQLLKIRNSWNTDVGDNGDYYMTYTYFETMNGDGTIMYSN